MPASIQGYPNVLTAPRFDQIRTGAVASPAPLAGRRFTIQGTVRAWDLRGRTLIKLHDGKGDAFLVLDPSSGLVNALNAAAASTPPIATLGGRFEPSEEGWRDHVQPGQLAAVVDVCRTDMLDEFPLAPAEVVDRSACEHPLSSRIQGSEYSVDRCGDCYLPLYPERPAPLTPADVIAVAPSVVRLAEAAARTEAKAAEIAASVGTELARATCAQCGKEGTKAGMHPSPEPDRDRDRWYCSACFAAIRGFKRWQEDLDRSPPIVQAFHQVLDALSRLDRDDQQRILRTLADLYGA